MSGLDFPHADMHTDLFVSISQTVAKVEWSKSKCDNLYFDCESDTGYEYKVIIGDGEIEVSYLDGGVSHLYKGTEIGSGHYKLAAVGFDGKATLHQFPDGKILEGYWIEDGYRGMWRIQLSQ